MHWWELLTTEEWIDIGIIMPFVLVLSAIISRQTVDVFCNFKKEKSND